MELSNISYINYVTVAKLECNYSSPVITWTEYYPKGICKNENQMEKQKQKISNCFSK